MPRARQRVGPPSQNKSDLALIIQIYNLEKASILDSILFEKRPLASEEQGTVQEFSEKGYCIVNSSSKLASIARLIL